MNKTESRNKKICIFYAYELGWALEMPLILGYLECVFFVFFFLYVTFGCFFFFSPLHSNAQDYGICVSGNSPYAGLLDGCKLSDNMHILECALCV